MIQIPILKANELTAEGNVYELSTLIKYANGKDDYVVKNGVLFKEISEEDLLKSVIANTKQLCLYKMDEMNFHSVSLVKKKEKWVKLHEVIKGVPFESSALLYPYLFVVIKGDTLNVVSFHRDYVSDAVEVTDFFSGKTINESLRKIYDLLKMDGRVYDWRNLWER